MPYSFLEYDSSLLSDLKTFASSTASNKDIITTVSSILEEIKAGGDKAVFEKTKLYDHANLTTAQLKVSIDELSSGFASLSDEELKALNDAQNNIFDFHQQSFPHDWTGTNSHGAEFGEKYYPIKRVGLYIPGGNVPLVSTVLMTVILAQVAKVPEIAVVTPPAADGTISPKLLGALQYLGINEVYKVGGAQAIGALAYGTNLIPSVDKIFGPGNAYVNEAKRQVFGTVGVDLLPGPSEVMVIADETANPEFVAAALLAQAEHGSGKEKVYFLFTEKYIFQQTMKELDVQAQKLSHKQSIVSLLKSGFKAVLVSDLDQIVEVANFIAPEHLELQVSENHLEILVKNITTAGALLLGHFTATALGDFIAGPSHVLPTGRSSRFSSGLRVHDFLRRSSIIKYDQEAVIKAEEHISSFAKMERLDGHGASVNIRTKPCR